MYLQGLVAALGLVLASAPLLASYGPGEIFSPANKVLDHFSCHKSSTYRCHHLKRNLKRDSARCLANPKVVMDTDLFLKEGEIYSVKGQVKFLGIFPGKYGYKIQKLGETIVLQTKVYFKNYREFSSSELRELQRKMDRAAANWSNQDIYPQLNLRFEVKITKSASEASLYNIKLVRKPTRGPYFKEWSTAWEVENLTHEFGHVFGLDDEYKNRPWATGNEGCEPGSVMCDSHQGHPEDYHYYLIMRRVFCSL